MSITERREIRDQPILFTPTLPELKKIAKPGTLVPIYCKVKDADLFTPVGSFLPIGLDRPYSFLFESVEVGEKIGRYSYLGVGNKERVIEVTPDAKEDPLEVVQTNLQRKVVNVPGLPPFHGGFVGYLSYECVRRWEEKVPPPQKDTIGVPDAIFFEVDEVVAFDHLRREMKVITHIPVDDTTTLERDYTLAQDRIMAIMGKLQSPRPNPSARAETAQGERFVNMSQEEYEKIVDIARDYIQQGDNLQTVLSLRISKKTDAHPFTIYRVLRGQNPSPFMFYTDFGNNFYLVGASPELLVKVDNGKVSTWPLAGTRRRGRTEDEDEALAEELIYDEKEVAEHSMLLDLGRNDISRISKVGTVTIPRFMEVGRYSTVMHIESQVRGELKDDLRPIDALRSCFPAGTVSGAPKVRAMEIIAELEKDRRGPYAGVVGYIDYNGDLEMAIEIRTIVVKDGVAHVQAGSGIVFDSVPRKEYEECLSKASAQVRSIEMAERGDF